MVPPWGRSVSLCHSWIPALFFISFVYCIFYSVQMPCVAMIQRTGTVGHHQLTQSFEFLALCHQIYNFWFAPTTALCPPGRQKGCANWPSLPSLLLANIWFLENKLDELRVRITTQCEIREYWTLIFTKTWLSDTVSECSVQPQTLSIHQAGQTSTSSMAKWEECVY